MAVALPVETEVPRTIRKDTVAPAPAAPLARRTVAVNVTVLRALTVVGNAESVTVIGSTTVTAAFAETVFNESPAVAFTVAAPNAASTGTVLVSVAVPVAPTASVRELTLKLLIQPAGKEELRLKVRAAQGEASLLRSVSVKDCEAPRVTETLEGESEIVGATFAQVLAMTVTLFVAVLECNESLAVASSA